MQITHIIFSLQVGGSENMLIDIIDEQIFLGHKVNLIIINNEINEKLKSDINKKVKIFELSRPSGSKNIFYVLKLYFLLYSRVTDILHCHNVSLGQILKFYKRKKIITLHTIGSFVPEVKNFDEIVSISEAVKKDLIENANCCSSVIHNGIKTSSILVKTYTSTNEFKILQVGRLDHETKGQDIAIRAFYKLKKKNNNLKVKLCFIGCGSSEVYLQKLVSALKLDNTVEFLGLKDKEYIYKHIKDYDLLIQPSRHEGFGLTIIEGMAAKVPVLVSNIEAPLEVIMNGKLGTSFQNENSDDLADKIYDHVYKFDIKKVNATYEYTLNNYDIKHTAQRYIDMYSNLIKGEK